MKNGHYIHEFKTSNPHKLFLSLAEKIKLKRSDKYVAFLKS